jgi:hypothetical protein
MMHSLAKRHPLDPAAEDLPKVLPLLPVSGMVLLPGGYLPLNVHESRYTHLIEDALRTPTRLIGLIQPRHFSEALKARGDSDQPAPRKGRKKQGDAASEDDTPNRIGGYHFQSIQVRGDLQLYDIGCAGRISAFSEEEDGQILVRLTGVCRFRVAKHMSDVNGYPRIRPDWQEFTEDLSSPLNIDGVINRDRFLPILREYFRLESIDVNWDMIHETGDEPLMTSLCLMCPFVSQEKQALLEAPTLSDRARILQALIEMAAVPDTLTGHAQH